MHSNQTPSLQHIAFLLSTIVLTLILSACGNSEDAAKVKAALEVNQLGITELELISPNTVIETTATEQFTIEDGNGEPLDIANKVKWSVSDKAIATINSSGLLSTKSPGLVTVKIQLADLSATKDIQVSSAALEEISIINDVEDYSVCSENNALIAKGKYEDEAELRTITNIVTWASDDLTTLSIGESSGRFATYKEGSANVTATRGEISGTTSISIEDDIESIQISANASSVYIDDTLAFTAIGTYDDSTTANITNTVSWASSNTGVLSVSNESATKGRATGISEGIANITATCLTTVNTVSNSVEIEVEPEPLVDGIFIEENKTIVTFKLIDSPEQLTANFKRSDGSIAADVSDDEFITWSIEETLDGEAIDDISSTGEITFTAVGTTKIKARYRDADNNIGPFEDTIEVEIIAN